MGFFKRINSSIFHFLYDSSINLKDRSFVVFSIAIIVALYLAVPSGIIMQEPLSATISTLVGAVLFTIYVFYAYKSDKIKHARIIISIIVVFAFLPAMFFTNGGVNGGAPVWILLGIFYLIMILEGKFRIVMNALNIIILLVCWIVAYFHPELVTDYNRWGNFYDTFTAIVIVGMVMTFIIAYQTRLYQRESKIAEDKTKELEELNRSQSRFFSSMSHEIRTPINTVLGLNEIILRQEDASDEIRKDARNIQGAGKMLLALINDILDFSKIEAGRMDIIPVEYSVGSLVSEMVNMIWMKAEQKGLEFKVDIDPNIPETLYGDEVRIKQVLINMLNNAVKYTPSGSVTLHMESEQVDENNIILTFVVSDTGMGIVPEAIPHLFDAFVRVDEESNRFIEGTGLGLSIVKQLIDLMHGEIKVSSVYTKGSAFTVTLPQKVASAKMIGNLSLSEGNAASATKFEHSFLAPEARILIVDDNEMNLEVESKLLEGTEMTIDLSGSGADALKKTLTVKYDAIFMDHLMPEMDGIECFDAIRSQKGGLNKNTPIVALTANAGSENKTLYNETGFNGYLVKPVSGAELENMIVSILPEEKLVRNENVELEGSTMNTAQGYSRKKPVCITTSTMCDIPETVIRELGIGIIPFSIKTDNGVFWDGVETVSDELIRYINEGGNKALSDSPTVEEFMKFFADNLQSAHHLIHITISREIAEEYNRAIQAAKAFDNVTVVDSHALSSATGMLTLVAVRLSQQSLPVERIVEELEKVRDKMRCSFVLARTDYMTKHGFISERANGILKALWLRPSLRINRYKKLGVDRFLMGNLKKCYEAYIKRALPVSAIPDRDILFITYADVSEEHLLWIEEKVRERFEFDRIVFQKASAAISSNCGPGTFGLLYMDRGETSYKLSKLIPPEEVIEEEPEDDVNYEMLQDTLHDLESILGNAAEAAADAEEAGPIEMPAPPVVEKKWYDGIEGLDVVTGLKNSGTEDIFKKLLGIFYESKDTKKGEIEDFFAAEDWNNYTIKVHALKSSSRLIGAVDLSREAEKLEMAGKASDIAYIKHNHEKVMGMFDDVHAKLVPVFGESSEEAEDDRPLAEDILMDGFFETLKEAVDGMDYNMVEEAFNELEGYRIPDKDKEVFDKLKAGFDMIDYDAMGAALSERQ